MKRNSGITLVEVMIVIVIVSIVLAIGVPSFQSFILNAQVKTAAESMQAGLSLARTEALRRNARVTLWLVDGVTATCVRSNTGGSWVVSMANPAGLCNVASSETVAPLLIQSRSGADGSTSVTVAAVDDANAASTCITFNGFGRVEAACTDGGAPIARVTFTPTTTSSGTRPLELRISSGGSARMCNPAVTVATNPAFCS